MVELDGTQYSIIAPRKTCRRCVIKDATILPEDKAFAAC